MQPQPSGTRRAHPRGITLIAALVAAAVLGIAVMLVIQAFRAMSLGTTGLNRRLKGDEAMVTASVGVSQADFGEILNQCRVRGILNAPERVGPCVVGGRLNPALGTPPPDTQAWTMEVLRDPYGRPSPQGTQCIELIRCRHLASGRVLEVLVQGNWVDDSQEGVTSRRLAFRRTRW